VEVYRPERWIEADKERRKTMESCMLHFIIGARTYIEKNLSLLEISKLVPSFLKRLELRPFFVSRPSNFSKIVLIRSIGPTGVPRSRVEATQCVVRETGELQYGV